MELEKNVYIRVKIATYYITDKLLDENKKLNAAWVFHENRNE